MSNLHHKPDFSILSTGLTLSDKNILTNQLILVPKMAYAISKRGLPLLQASKHLSQGWITLYPTTFPHPKQAASRIRHEQFFVTYSLSTKATPAGFLSVEYSSTAVFPKSMARIPRSQRFVEQCEQYRPQTALLLNWGWIEGFTVPFGGVDLAAALLFCEIETRVTLLFEWVLANACAAACRRRDDDVGWNECDSSS